MSLYKAYPERKERKWKTTGKNRFRRKENCKPLTDEEFKAYQEKDKRTTNKVLRFFKAIWEAINFFS